jgi:hypothetical protein
MPAVDAFAMIVRKAKATGACLDQHEFNATGLFVYFLM